MYNCAKWKKGTKFTQFEQKNTHISKCKIVHLYTIATVTVYICTVTVACAFNILLVFSLSCLCSHSHSHRTLSCHCSHLTSLPLFLICSHSHHCHQSNHAFPPTDFELHHLFVDFLCRRRDSEILVGTHWSDMKMRWTTWWTSASSINLRSHSRGGSTFRTH